MEDQTVQGSAENMLNFKEAGDLIFPDMLWVKNIIVACIVIKISQFCVVYTDDP